MAIRNLVPSLWGRSGFPARQEGGFPVFSLQREVNQLFDDFFRGFDVPPFGTPADRVRGFFPVVDVEENEKELTARIELPGIDEKDVELLIAGDFLTIKGEKKQEQETKGKGYYQMERAYGSFHREIPLPAGLDTENVEATYKNGVLTVRIPKTSPAKSEGTKITIKNG